MEIRFSRSQRTSFSFVAVVSLLFLLAGIGVGEAVDSFSRGPSLRSVSDSGKSEFRKIAAGQSLPDFTGLAKQLGPVVVNISTTQVNKAPEAMPSPFGENDPFNEFWHRFFGGPFPRGPQRQRSLGSGFIIGRDGTILTNYHVVDDAEKIVVKLADQREFEAKVVGKDQKTDVAIVKIDTHEDLPVASLGDSDRLQVGEWVVAIGNPFGLDHTVTAGIVSAKSRHIGAGPYDDFIQTDASINPGNSGGPLINLRGEVVGINSAIFSQSGGNIGIGFAIPINLVKELLPQLKEKGRVVRGFMGVVIQKVTPEIAQGLELAKPHGALVAEVSKDGPADRAGVKVGDIIVRFDGKEVGDSGYLAILVARTPPGKKVQVKVWRDKKEVSLSLTVGEMKESELALSEEGDLGLAVQAVTPEIAENLGLDKAQGVVVTSVKPGSSADEAGLRRGDVIIEVDRRPVRDLSDYRKALAGVEKGKSILFLVRRGQSSMFLALKP